MYARACAETSRGSELKKRKKAAQASRSDPAGARLLRVGDEDGGVGHRPVDAGTSPKNGH